MSIKWEVTQYLGMRGDVSVLAYQSGVGWSLQRKTRGLFTSDEAQHATVALAIEDAELGLLEPLTWTINALKAELDGMGVTVYYQWTRNVKKWECQIKRDRGNPISFWSNTLPGVMSELDRRLEQLGCEHKVIEWSTWPFLGHAGTHTGECQSCGVRIRHEVTIG